MVIQFNLTVSLAPQLEGCALNVLEIIKKLDVSLAGSSQFHFFHFLANLYHEFGLFGAHPIQVSTCLSLRYVEILRY